MFFLSASFIAHWGEVGDAEVFKWVDGAVALVDAVAVALTACLAWAGVGFDGFATGTFP